MGLPFVDYLIADKIVVPPERRAHYAEKIIYLPDTYYVTDDGRPIGDTPSVAAVGLPERGFVFASFNASFKITREEFSIWVRLLHHVEGSVLWLLATNAWAEANLRREAAAAGLSPDRLSLSPPALRAGHIARHRLADLVPRQLQLQRPHHRNRRALGGPAARDQGGRKLYGARRRQPASGRSTFPSSSRPRRKTMQARALELATNPPELHRIRVKAGAKTG